MSTTTKMKSIRLNKELRENIVNNIMESFDIENTAPPEAKDTQKLLNIAVYDYYLETYKQQFIELQKWSKKYPKVVAMTSALQYIDTQKNVCRLNFTTMTSVSYLDGVYISDTDPLYVNHPNVLQGMFIDLGNMEKIPENISKTLDEIQKEKKNDKAIRKALSIYTKERKEYKETVTNVIAGVNTTGQLIEVWGEIDKFIPKGVANPSEINLPAVNTKSLNSKIGIA